MGLDLSYDQYILHSLHPENDVSMEMQYKCVYPLFVFACVCRLALRFENDAAVHHCQAEQVGMGFWFTEIIYMKAFT